MQHVGVVLYGLYIYGRDQNLLPVDESGKPRVQFPIHPDTKFAFEYQIRSEQAVDSAVLTRNGSTADSLPV